MAGALWYAYTGTELFRRVHEATLSAKAAEQLWPGLQGRKTMLAPGARKHAGAKGDVVREMALAERKYKTLAKTQASTATQIRSFAKSLLSSQRQASAELRDLEKHFG